jgi:hypothetical protein
VTPAALERRRERARRLAAKRPVVTATVAVRRVYDPAKLERLLAILDAMLDNAPSPREPREP